MSMDLIQGLVTKVPESMRLMVKKRECPICAEAERAVNMFNSERLKNCIKVIDSRSLEFKRYYSVFQYIHQSENIPTPTIYFDGHVITYKQGGCEYIELYHLLNELDRLSRR